MQPFTEETRKRLMDGDDLVHPNDIDELQTLISERMSFNPYGNPKLAQSLDREIAARIQKMKNYAHVVGGVDIESLLNSNYSRLPTDRGQS
ncbi:MAG: hypothetical protein ABJB74_21600 [Gemmatimonas sp.]